MYINIMNLYIYIYIYICNSLRLGSLRSYPCSKVTARSDIDARTRQGEDTRFR